MVVKGSFEDIIYILAGLVWVAFSIYKGSQKQKKAKASGGEKNKSKSTVEQFIGEFLGVKEDNIVYQDEEVSTENGEVLFDEVEEAETQEKYQPTELSSYDDKYEEGNFFKEKQVLTPEDGKVKRLKVTNEKKPIRKRKKPRFDVRKAIIYSEILKRPVY